MSTQRCLLLSFAAGLVAVVPGLHEANQSFLRREAQLGSRADGVVESADRKFASLNRPLLAGEQLIELSSNAFSDMAGESSEQTNPFERRVVRALGRVLSKERGEKLVEEEVAEQSEQEKNGIRPISNNELWPFSNKPSKQKYGSVEELARKMKQVPVKSRSQREYLMNARYSEEENFREEMDRMRNVREKNMKQRMDDEEERNSMDAQDTKDQKDYEGRMTSEDAMSSTAIEDELSRSLDRQASAAAELASEKGDHAMDKVASTEADLERQSMQALAERNVDRDTDAAGARAKLTRTHGTVHTNSRSLKPEIAAEYGIELDPPDPPEEYDYSGGGDDGGDGY